jgi:hypothetical protein
LTPEAPPIPGQPEEDPRYAGSPYRYNLAPGFQGSIPTRPNPYYRPTGLGYAEGGDVKKKEEVAAAPQPKSELMQNMFKGLSGQPGLKSYQVTDPITQAVPYMMGAKMRGILGEELQDKIDAFLRPAATSMGATSGGVPEGYVLDRRTGQLVPASSYSPQGLGYTGYAEGGDIMMAAGGSYEDEPMGDGVGMAAGGIAGYAAGGLKMKTMSLGEGMYRDTDTDTASLGAYDAAKKRMEKQFAAANLKPREMPKSGIAKLGQMKAMAEGGLGSYSDGGRMLKGPGDGMSDDIPAVIGRKQPARLADGEFVVPADVVSHLGNGSTDAGAKKLYSMMDKIRTARTGKKKQAPAVKGDKYLPKFADGGSVATAAPTAVSAPVATVADPYTTPFGAYPGSGMSLADITSLGNLISGGNRGLTQAPTQASTQGFTDTDLAAKLAAASANRTAFAPVEFAKPSANINYANVRPNTLIDPAAAGWSLVPGWTRAIEGFDANSAYNRDTNISSKAAFTPLPEGSYVDPQGRAWMHSSVK